MGLCFNIHNIIKSNYLPTKSVWSPGYFTTSAAIRQEGEHQQLLRMLSFSLVSPTFNMLDSAPAIFKEQLLNSMEFTIA